MKKEHFEILLEDMKSDIKLVLEGHHVLHNEIIRTREELREEIKLNTTRIEALNEKVDQNTIRIEALNEKVDQNTIRIEALNEKVDQNTVGIDAVAADLKAHRADTENHHGVYRVRELKKD